MLNSKTRRTTKQDPCCYTGSCFLWPSNRAPGSSLAEMVISLAVLSLAILPIIFMSSAWFSKQLVDTREKFALSHDSSQWINRLIDELSQSSSLMQSSNNKQLNFSYYDAASNRVQKRHYNLSSNVKTKVSSNSQFEYCNQTLCGVPPSRATILQLQHWQFLSDNTTHQKEQTLDIPTLKIHLNSSSKDYPKTAASLQQAYSFSLEDQAMENTFISFLTPGHNLASLSPQNILRFYYSGTPSHQDIQLHQNITASSIRQTFDGDLFVSSANQPIISELSPYRTTDPIRNPPRLIRQYNLQQWVEQIDSFGIQPNTDDSKRLVSLNSLTKEVTLFKHLKKAGLPSTSPTSFTLENLKNPTCIGLHRKNNTILILDSFRDSKNQITIHTYSPEGKQLKALAIPLKRLTPKPTDVRFSFQLDSQSNTLYLTGKDSGQVYSLRLPVLL